MLGELGAVGVSAALVVGAAGAVATGAATTPLLSLEETAATGTRNKRKIVMKENVLSKKVSGAYHYT